MFSLILIFLLFPGSYANVNELSQLNNSNGQVPNAWYSQKEPTEECKKNYNELVTSVISNCDKMKLEKRSLVDPFENLDKEVFIY